MARNISVHTRYRLAATAFAVLGVVWCLGALIWNRETTLLVVGMMHLAVSMLFMSLRPSTERAVEPRSEGCDRCSGLKQDEARARVKLATRRIERPGDTKEPTIIAGDTRPRERKSRTWSI